jgi:hypothetical protein
MMSNRWATAKVLTLTLITPTHEYTTEHIDVRSPFFLDPVGRNDTDIDSVIIEGIAVWVQAQQWAYRII